MILEYKNGRLYAPLKENKNFDNTFLTIKKDGINYVFVINKDFNLNEILELFRGA